MPEHVHRWLVVDRDIEWADQTCRGCGEERAVRKWNRDGSLADKRPLRYSEREAWRDQGEREWWAEQMVWDNTRRH